MADRTLTVKILGDERDLLRAFGSSTRGVRQFEGQMTGVSRSVRNVFAAAGVALGATAIVQALRSTVNAAIDFESSFAGVRKTVDATEPQLQALALGFRALAREIPVSVEELNRIGEAAGQLGIQRKGILDFTETVAALGVTTNLASEQAADAMARLANITQIPQDQFDNLGSTVVDLGNKLAATESEIVDFGLRIAAAGKIVGLTVDQTLAIAGAFSSVGIEAEAGGTAVSKVFISLANAVETGGKQLQTFADTAGTSIAEFRRLFEADTAGAFTAFVQGLKRVDAEGGNVFQTLRDLGLSDVRLIRAFLSISQSGDLLTRSLATGSRAWEQNSALLEEARKRYGTTASQLQIFQNKVNDLQITLGEVLAPALLEIIKPLEKWIEKTENQERVQKALIDTMEDARAVFDGVRAVVVPLAEAVKSLADRMGGLANAVELLLVAMVAAKIVSFGTAISGLGATAAATTGRVNALRFALLRLGAIGVIALSIEFLINYDELQSKAAGINKRIGEILGLTQTVDLEPKLRLERLQAQLRQVNSLLGADSDRAKELRAEIEKVMRLLDRGGKGIDPAADEHGRSHGTPGFKEKEAAASAAAPIVAGAEAKTVATEKAIASGQKDNAALIAAEKREQEALRLSRIKAARTSRQFEALGLTAEGAERVPGVGALRGRLGNLREQLKGTTLDTDKTRLQLAAIAKVLSGAFGKAGRDVRQAILDMLNDISSALESGDSGTQGPLTKFKKRGVESLLAGIGLSEEETKELRQRMARIGAGGTSPGSGVGAFGQQVVGVTAGGGTFVIHTHIHLDGKEVAVNTTRHQQKQRGRGGGSRRGVRPGFGGV